MTARAARQTKYWLPVQGLSASPSALGRFSELAVEPGTGQRPAPLQRGRRHPERVRGLLDAETGEKAQFDNPRLLGVDFLEPRQRLVERGQHAFGVRRHRQRV